MLNGLILYAIPYPAVELPFYMIITQKEKKHVTKMEANAMQEDNNRIEA
jgi:hypothetical protein